MTRTAVIAFLVSAGVAHAQGVLPPRDVTSSTPTGTARMQGRIVTADTGQPLRRVQIAIFASEGNVRRVVTTDADGRYEFVDVPAGRYTLSASKAGYVTLQYGQRRPFEPGRPIAIAEGQRLSGLDVSLPRGSVIAGRVTDEFGEPLASAMVQAQRYQYSPGGERRLTYAAPPVTSDDLGQFRLFGLMPGEYVVSARQGSQVTIVQAAGRTSDASEGYVATFYPGTTTPGEAQPISIGLGQEVPITFSLIATRMSQISGVALTSRGRPATGGNVTLQVNADADGAFMTFGGQVLLDGSFTVANVPPGDHAIQIRATVDDQMEFVSVPVAVAGKNVEGLKVTTRAPVSVSGTVVFEGTASRTGAPLRIIARQTQPQSFAFGYVDPLTNGRVGDDGRFEIKGVLGRALLVATTSPPWTLKEVTLDGEDITDTPLDLSATNISGLRVVLTDKLTDVSGRVIGNRADVLKDYVVVVQPAEPKEGIAVVRYLRTARPDQDGRFDIKSLPPGRYIATALATLEQGSEWDPAFQNRLRDAGRNFSMKEGESVTLDLTLSSVAH